VLHNGHSFGAGYPPSTSADNTLLDLHTKEVSMSYSALFLNVRISSRLTMSILSWEAGFYLSSKKDHTPTPKWRRLFFFCFYKYSLRTNLIPLWAKILEVRPENPKPVQNLQVLILRQTKFFSYRNPFPWAINIVLSFFFKKKKIRVKANT